MEITRLDSAHSNFDADLEQLLRWELDSGGEVDAAAAEVIDVVRRDGDAAVLDYTRRFDRLPCESVTQLKLAADDFAAAFERIGGIERTALSNAADRIRRYHTAQLDSDWSFEDELGNRFQ